MMTLGGYSPHYPLGKRTQGVLAPARTGVANQTHLGHYRKLIDVSATLWIYS